MCCPSVAATIVCALVCVVAPASLVAVHVARNPLFSPVDEAQHFDYVQRISHGNVPRLGEKLLPTTNDLYACRGRAAPGWPAYCPRTIKTDLAIIAQTDDQYEAQQPPLYYAATALMRWPFVHVLGVDTLDGTRATGAIWLIAGLLALWMAGMIMGLDWRVVGAVALVMCVGPDTIYAASFVGNDAASIFGGSVVCLLGAIAWRRPATLPLWVYALVGFLLALLKEVDVFPVGVVAGVFAVGAIARAWRQRRAALAGAVTEARNQELPWTPQLRCAAAMVLGAIVGSLLWTVVYLHLSLVKPSTLPAFVIERPFHTAGQIWDQAVRMLFPLTSSAAPGELYQSSPFPGQPGSAFSVRLSGYDHILLATLLLSAGVMGLFTRKHDWPHWLGALSLLGMYAGGWVLSIGSFASYHIYTDLPGRYALPLVPLLALAAAGVMRTDWFARVIWAFGGLTFALSFYYMYA